MKQYFSRSYILEILAKSGAIILILYFFLWPVEIIGDSMLNNISDGDFVLISRIPVYLNLLDYSDVITYKFEDTEVVKRLIAFPGDHVVITGGEVFVNGQKLTEQYIKGTYTDGEVDLYLNSGEYYILGDNRSVSYDSRQIGSVSRQKITGKVLVRFLPIWDFKIY